MNARLGLAALLVSLTSLVAAPALPWGDQGDGTYRNPILPADYSDPDVIRVGDDFYLTASDFHFVGMQILHSRDLVNWRIIGQVFDRLPMDAKYDELRAYSQGTWAPTLRFHDGLFQIYVCTPHEGLFRWTAKNPAGPWSFTTVKTVDRWEDPCPFWDDDGQGYLVHSQLGAGPLILHKLSADGARLLDDGKEIYRGPVAEGPKLFKRHGWYYISLPEGGVEKGGQTILRSRELYGPYEKRVALADRNPHQGGIVELDHGEAWFIGFKSSGHLGRVCHLIPVRWGEDDWPVFGENGQTVTQHKKPSLPVVPRLWPQMSDSFEGAMLAPQWQWNHNPVPAAWSLSERPGWLRLHGLPAAEIKFARNTLTQKLWGDAGVFETKLVVRALSDGQRAGFAFMSGSFFGWIGAEKKDGAVRIAWDGGAGNEIAGGTLWLRGTYEGNTGRLHYSFDGEKFETLETPVTLRFSQWKGARVALFCFGDGGGYVDIDSVDYRCSATP